MSEKKENPAAEAISSPLGSLDQIRDIILGENIEAWEKQFAKLEGSIEKLRSDTSAQFKKIQENIDANSNQTLDETGKLAEKSEQAANELRELLMKFRKDLDKRIDELGEAKVDKDSIGEVFIQWGQRVKSKS